MSPVQADWLLDAPVAINTVMVGGVVVFEGIPSECGNPPLGRPASTVTTAH